MCIRDRSRAVGENVLISGHVLVIKQRPGILVDDARNSQSARALEFLDGEDVYKRQYLLCLPQNNVLALSNFIIY